jgi:hypothetical protein
MFTNQKSRSLQQLKCSWSTQLTKTKQQCEKAKKARELYYALGSPTIQNFKQSSE